jgi:hypothetical protein
MFSMIPLFLGGLLALTIESRVAGFAVWLLGAVAMLLVYWRTAPLVPK